MARIEFELSTLSAKEARSIIAMLQVIAEDRQLLPSIFKAEPSTPVVPVTLPTNPSAVPAVPTSEQSKAVTQYPAAAAEGKVRRVGRPTKEEAAAKKAQEAAAQAPAPGPTPDPTPAPSGSAVAAVPSPEPPTPPVGAGAAQKYSVEELRTALQQFTVATDLKRGKELLSSYGCVRITDMMEKAANVQAEFMQKCGV